MPEPKNGSVKVFANLNSAPLILRISMASAAYAMSVLIVNADSSSDRKCVVSNMTYPLTPYSPHHICPRQDPIALLEP